MHLIMYMQQNDRTWSHLHFGVLQRVVIASETDPHYTCTIQLHVFAVQAAPETPSEPPGSVILSTRPTGHVVVLIFSTELHSFVIIQRITCRQTY